MTKSGCNSTAGADTVARMLKKLTLLFAVIVLAFGVVACGGDDEEPASSGTETTETTEDTGGTETTEDTGDTEDTGGEEDTGGIEDNPDVQAAVESCKQAVQAQSGTLSDDLITELEGICDDAATDPEGAQEAAVEVCVKIAEEMVPEGSARDQVIEQCEAAAP